MKEKCKCGRADCDECWNRGREESFRKDDEEAEQRIQGNRMSGESCPQCGSHNYVSATKAEECYACGYSQGYW